MEEESRVFFKLILVPASVGDFFLLSFGGGAIAKKIYCEIYLFTLYLADSWTFYVYIFGVF